MRHIADRIWSLLLILLFVAAGCLGASDGTVYAAEGKSSFQVDFIDVGQGDASLVQCDGHYMLIDGGGSKKSSLIYSYLKQRKIDHLDAIVATHSDADHVGGLSGALNYAKADAAYCSVTDHDSKEFQSFKKYLGAQGRSITVPKAGDSFMLGGAKVSVLGPVRSAADANNNSIILRVTYGKTSFLFAGDAEGEEETDLVESGTALASTVLKVAHHGSKYSTGYRFLRETSPAYAVISVGKDNPYGHPTEEVLSRLRDAGVRTYRTDLQGHIVCVSDGKTVSFTPQKNKDADTLAGAGSGQNNTTQTDDGLIQFEILPQAGTDQSMDRSLPGNVGQPAGQQTYILNTKSHKFHYPDCGSVAKMAEKNKEVYTGSREDLIAQGYDPCMNCNP